MRLEPAISAYRAVRRKKHGIGGGSRLRALKLALAMYCVSNGVFPWHARLAWWLALHGTPQMPLSR
jgi:hypothetical protein